MLIGIPISLLLMIIWKWHRTKGTLMKNYTILVACILITACASSTPKNINKEVGQLYLPQVIDTKSYRLASGDKIKINVFKEADLSFLEINISESGIFNYPHLNEIKLSGLTVHEVQSLITKGLLDGVLKDPLVQVSIVEYRPFFIDGEIQVSGEYPFQPGLTVRKAIILAGGLSERASESKIYIIRATNLGQGKIKVTMDDYIYPGDVLTIDESFF